MYLPTDIWEKIMLSLNNGASCERLYNALPKKLQNEIMYPYMDHRKMINTRILCAVKNTTALFIENGIYVKFYHDYLVENDVIFVKYGPNMITRDGVRNCIITATRNGTVMFWDAHSNRYIDRIDIDNKIEHLELHPNKSEIVISTINRGGLEIQSLIFWEGGITFNETIIGYDKDYEIKLVYHPTLPHLYIIRSTKNIISVYLWKYEEIYDEDSDNDLFVYSEFERIELPTIINFSINSVESYIYTYHIPFKITNKGEFECLSKGLHHYSIVRMEIRNSRFFIKEVEILLYPCREVNDYLRVGTKIYYIENGCNIIEQHGMTTTVLYISEENLSKIEIRNGNLIFLEGDLFKRIDLDTRGIDILFNWRTDIMEDGDIALGAYCII
jgi:hypothetical protein